MALMKPASFRLSVRLPLPIVKAATGPSLIPQLVEEVKSSCALMAELVRTPVDQGAIVLFSSAPSGVGKTHLAYSVGRKDALTVVVDLSMAKTTLCAELTNVNASLGVPNLRREAEGIVTTFLRSIFLVAYILAAYCIQVGSSKPVIHEFFSVLLPQWC